MRTIFLLPALLVTACSVTKFYHPLINDIPVKSSNKPPVVIFEGEGVPAKPYFEVMDIIVEEKGRLSREGVQLRIEKEAKSEGLDGVIEVTSERTSYEGANFNTFMVDVLADDGITRVADIPYTRIRGRGIMFVESLDFIGDLPEYEYFYLVDGKDGSEPFLKIEYKLTGQEHKVYPMNEDAQKFYNQYIRFYSDFHLLRQRDNWLYEVEGAKVARRKLVDPIGGVEKEVNIAYNQRNLPGTLTIRHFTIPRRHNEQVHYYYDAEDRLSGRVLKLSDMTTVRENHVFENGKLKSREISVHKSRKTPVFVRSYIHYYDREYLKEFYDTIYIHNQSKPRTVY